MGNTSSNHINTISVLNTCERGDIRALHRVLRSHDRINPDFTDKRSTPLHVACEKGDVDMVKILVAYNANKKKRRGFFGGTPKSIAKKKEVVNELRKPPNEKYKVLPIALVEKKIEQESCSICCEDFQDDTVHLYCGHPIHFKCLKQWDMYLNTDRITCPLCRASTKREVFK